MFANRMVRNANLSFQLVLFFSFFFWGAAWNKHVCISGEIYLPFFSKDTYIGQIEIITLRAISRKYAVTNTPTFTL